MNSKFILPQCLAFCIQLWIVCESSTLLEDILDEEKMGEAVDDIFDEPLEEEGRFFNFDRGYAFNNSVALQIPIFAFKLPGADETEATGLHANSFGVIGFAALFIVGSLGLAIYTTTQGGNEDGAVVLREFGPSNYFHSSFLNKVYDSLFELPDALSFESCAKLSICYVFSESKKFGMLFWALKVLVSYGTDESDKMNLNQYKKAALLGSVNPDECYEEYPCLIQSLDFLYYLKDYFTSTY